MYEREIGMYQNLGRNSAEDAGKGLCPARQSQIPMEIGKIHERIEGLHKQADFLRERLLGVLNPRINDPTPPPPPNPKIEEKRVEERCAMAVNLHGILISLTELANKLDAINANLEL